MTVGINHKMLAKQRGFSLLEVMVASIVLSVSLLGLLALHGISFFSSFEARQRTQAVYAATDIVERVRMNKQAWLASQLAAANSSVNITVGPPPNVQQAIPGCGNVSGIMNCVAPADVVAFDIFEWQEYINESAITGASYFRTPVGCLSLTRDGNTDITTSQITMQVIISWQDKEDMQNVRALNGNTCGMDNNRNRQLVVNTRI